MLAGQSQLQDADWMESHMSVEEFIELKKLFPQHVFISRPQGHDQDYAPLPSKGENLHVVLWEWVREHVLCYC